MKRAACISAPCMRAGSSIVQLVVHLDDMACAELAASASRFCAEIYAKIEEACTSGDAIERLGALPALALVAAKWPNQPVVVRHGKPVAAVDEAMLALCSAAIDLDPLVRLQSLPTAAQLQAPVPLPTSQCLRDASVSCPERATHNCWSLCATEHELHDNALQVRLCAARQLRHLSGASEQYQRLAMQKRGTLRVEAPPGGPAAGGRLPEGDASLLDHASGAYLHPTLSGHINCCVAA
jgi:hypothetical protein